MFTLSNYPLPDKIEVLKREGYRLLGYAWLCDKYGLEPIDQIKCNVIAHPKKNWVVYVTDKSTVFINGTLIKKRHRRALCFLLRANIMLSGS